VTEAHETLADILPGGTPTRDSLYGGHASDDEDPKTLLARFGQGEPSTTTSTETELQRILALNDELEPEEKALATDDLKKMLAEMSQDNEYDGDDVSSMLANLDEASTRDEADDDESSDPKQMLSDIGRSESVVDDVGVSGDDVSSMLANLEGELTKRVGDTRPDEAESTDPKQMLAEFERTEPVVGDVTVSGNDDRFMPASSEEELVRDEGARSGEAESTELQQMLAEFEHTNLVMGDMAVSTDGDGELRSMLAEFERRTSFEGPESHTGSQYDVDPRSMLAEFEQQTPLLGQEDGDEDLEALHGRLTSMLSSAATLRSPDREHTEGEKHESQFNQAIMPYVVAIHLETAGFSWEKALGWTTYLFSSGLDGYKACQEKDKIVSQASEELERIIQQVLEEETVHQTLENKARLPRRLIVSNIAADASEEDLREFFYSFRFAMYVMTVALIDEPTC
jgi:hypothetical protein